MRLLALMLPAAFASACLTVTEVSPLPTPTAGRLATATVVPSATAVASPPTETTTPSPTPTSTPPSNLPDLVIVNMQVERDIQVEEGGCTVSYIPRGVSVIVANVGPLDAGAFVIDLNGTQQEVQPGLAALKSIRLHFDESAPGGVYVAAADKDNGVVELNEDNNSRSFLAATPIPSAPCTATPGVSPAPGGTTIPTPTAVGLPDLVITGLESDWPCTSPSQPLSLSVGVKNLGDGWVGSFVVDVSGEQFTIVPGLPPHQEASWSPGGPPTGQAWVVVVDATGLIEEGNEDNNVGILGVPPPCVPMSTPTVNASSGPPMGPYLRVPEEGAWLTPQYSWLFLWWAEPSPCYSAITINGPGARKLGDGHVESTSVDHRYTYDPRHLPLDAVGRWTWYVEVVCPAGASRSGVASFNFVFHTPTPTPAGH